MTATLRFALTAPTGIATLALAAQVACGGPSAPPGPDTAAPAITTSLTLEHLLDIRHPSQATWSPASDRVAFVWDRAGVQNIFVVEPSATTPSPAMLTSFDEGLLDLVGWTADAGAVLFAKDGDLWRAPPGTPMPERVWTTPEAESTIVLSNDRRRVAFVRGGDLWTRSLDDAREVRLTNTPEVEGSPVWAPDDAQLAFTRVVARPEDEATPWNGAKMIFRRVDREPSDLGVVSASGGPARMLGATPGAEGAPRWLDTGRLVFQRVTAGLRTREIVVGDVASGVTRVVHRDEDEKWWSLTYLGPEPMPSPDGCLIAFLSDRDGWDHAYVVPAAGGDAVQVTRGAFEVSRLRWSPDGRRLAFDSNEGPLPGARHLAVVEIDASGRPGASTRLTGERGTNTDAFWSPDGTRLVFQRTGPRASADLFVIGTNANAPAAQLTESMPAAIDRSALVEPEFVRYPSADGSDVPAYLFVPPGLDRSRRHPAIVWVHGDGVTQNYDGWHLRRDYAVYHSVHQWLVQQGYVVLMVDYRGSIGYGKAWRQGHYRDLGGRDYEDVAAATDYLATLGYVDTDRIGVWGLSYGGFMTLQALTVTPERFRCGIDVAGVVDWRDWYRDPNGPWIKGRMGPPEDNPDLYRRTAPIERVDRLVRPLLVLHGTADVNVPFLESLRLVDVALKAGKEVDFMIYPGEFHYFHREHVLRDAWTRVQGFFDRCLR